jgi:hypothetical protein
MKITAYLIAKSLIQGAYKGTLFFSAFYFLLLLHSFTQNSYFFVKALNGAFSYNSESQEFLTGMNQGILQGYIITLAISFILITINNLKNKK